MDTALRCACGKPAGFPEVARECVGCNGVVGKPFHNFHGDEVVFKAGSDDMEKVAPSQIAVQQFRIADKCRPDSSQHVVDIARHNTALRMAASEDARRIHEACVDAITKETRVTSGTQQSDTTAQGRRKHASSTRSAKTVEKHGPQPFAHDERTRLAHLGLYISGISPGPGSIEKVELVLWQNARQEINLEALSQVFDICGANHSDMIAAIWLADGADRESRMAYGVLDAMRRAGLGGLGD